jgi:DNA mismatch repair ATPase MutS
MRRWVSLLSVKGNPALHFILNLLVPWDFWLATRLERSRRGLARELPVWIETLARFEAFQSLALFADIFSEQVVYPAVAEPAPGKAGPMLEAEGLGHPLIPSATRVSNSIRLGSSQPCLLITGSNMSGKSTWLRTVGVNACLAMAGAPVVAAKFAFTGARIETSLRKRDSLEDEVSTFYAEVKRLKSVLDSARGGNALYLIDEIFQGTNNRERLIGSQAYAEALLATSSIGLIATHDLELAELEGDHPRLRNMHFRETIEGERMRFTHELREGPCPSTNALRIMELAGLPSSTRPRKGPV